MVSIPSSQEIKNITGMVIDIVKKGATLAEQEKVVRLREIVLELREAILELQEENLKLKEKISGLQSKKKTEESMMWDGEFYWFEDKNGEGEIVKKDGPFCQKCYDDERKLIRLQVVDENWYCAVCRIFYSKAKQIS